jgi:uncharacterized membrane-anchored protein YitT (DUF2179 family)
VARLTTSLPSLEKKQLGRSLVKMLTGNLVMALAYAKWMVPNKIINGGVTSLALVLRKVTSFSITSLTNGLTMLLLVLCLCFLGKEIFLKSIFSSVTYLFFFNLFYALPFQLHTVIWLDMILACGAIAFGYYCSLSTNSSTVGVDVIALIIHQKKPSLKLAPMIRNLNFSILAMSLFVLGLKPIIWGIMFTVGYAFLLKKMLKE